MNQNVNNLIVGDTISFTSEKFRYVDDNKKWFVIEKNDKSLRLEADDSELIKLFPPRGKYRITINIKYWGDINIK